MDTEERKIAPFKLLLQMQKLALQAQVALEGRTRAEFRADAQAQAAVIGRLDSLCECSRELGKLLKSHLKSHQVIREAFMAAPENIPGQVPNLKRVYNFVHQGLPILVAVIDEQIESLKLDSE